MAGRAESSLLRGPVVYCVVPADLAAVLHEMLRHHFRDDPRVRVVVERRLGDRRERDDRRMIAGDGGVERRLVRSVSGRRIAERRAAVVEVGPPELPRRARGLADRLVFVERLEPSDQAAEDLDTARVVIAIQAGDRDLFALVYERYFDRVYQYLKAMLRTAADAEDGTQQVFLNALSALARYEHRGQPFRAWLFRIARNYALDQLRERSRYEALAPDEMLRGRDQRVDLAAPIPALSWLRDSELMLFVERLPVLQRQVLMLRFTADLSHQEIAAIVGRSPEAVRMLQSRALAFLRQRLVALGGDTRCLNRVRMRRWPREATVLRSRRWALTR